MLTLYFSPGSSSFATHIALHEVGATFEAKPTLLANKETRTPQFLAINPEGKVPALLIDGRVLTEVAGTLFYLARRFPQAGLLPAGDIEAEARVVSWMSFNASALHPALRQSVEHARALYAIADARLGSNDWVVGNRYSIADIHLFRLFWRFRGSLELQPGDFPNLERHRARMLERPAVIKTLEIESKVGQEPA